MTSVKQDLIRALQFFTRSRSGSLGGMANDDGGKGDGNEFGDDNAKGSIMESGKTMRQRMSIVKIVFCLRTDSSVCECANV
jgi:hypothetical protein